jgi:hypothetical protein
LAHFHAIYCDNIAIFVARSIAIVGFYGIVAATAHLNHTLFGLSDGKRATTRQGEFIERSIGATRSDKQEKENSYYVTYLIHTH